jgi:hypothetical protein
MPETPSTTSAPQAAGFWRALDTWIPALLLFAFLGLVLIQEAAFSGEQYLNPGDGDCNYYIEQAIHPFSVRVNPFAFRNLTPVLVRAIKVNSNHMLNWDGAWYIFTFAMVYATGLLFFRFCRRVLKLSPSVACLAALILLANWVYGRFQLEIPFFPDPLNNFLWMLAFYLLFTERWGWFHVTIILGMLNKEVILFLVPLCPLFVYLKTGRLWSKPVLQHAAMAVAVCASYWAYRSGLGHYWNMAEYRLLSTNDWGVLSSVLIGVNQQKSLWHLFITFGFLWITFLFMLRELYVAQGWRNRHLVASLVVFAICFFSRLYSTDVSRIYVMMSPLVVGLSIAYLDKVFGEHKFAALVVLFFLVLAGNHEWVEGRAWLTFLNGAAAFYVLKYAKPVPADQVPA